MRESKYIKLVREDFPQAKMLIDQGLITEQSAEVYAIRKKYKEIRPTVETSKEAIEALSEEFPKSEASIYLYTRDIVINF